MLGRSGEENLVRSMISRGFSRLTFHALAAFSGFPHIPCPCGIQFNSMPLRHPAAFRQLYALAASSGFPPTLCPCGIQRFSAFAAVFRICSRLSAQLPAVFREFSVKVSRHIPQVCGWVATLHRGCPRRRRSVKKPVPLTRLLRNFGGFPH